ncbi:MAG: hypothetical protein R2762_30150 [Bryobacteraceae bacterium]
MTGVTNLHLAPAPVRVDGLWAVPIDIQSLDATLYFDAAQCSAEAEVYLEFVHGAKTGCPVFDLRQPIAEAWLDGQTIDPARMAHHDFGAGPESSMRILEARCRPGSRHSLRIRYPLDRPAAVDVGSRLPGLVWVPGLGVRFNFGFSDLGPGRYLDSWLPANLIYDQHAVDIGVTITGVKEPHVAIHNGNWATQLARNRWWIEYRRYSTSLSPMLELHPARLVRGKRTETRLPVSRKRVTIEMWKDVQDRTRLGPLAKEVAGWLAGHERAMGRYVHGDRFVVYLQERGGMEYDGGCTSSVEALYHEVFHSWWARGLKPASQNDGWIDEAWTVYCDEHPDTAIAFDWDAPPITLSPGHPWWRSTPREAYREGVRMFQGIAHLLGSAKKLHRAMRAFYKANAPGFVTTAELEAHLSPLHPDVHRAFARFVYGRIDGEQGRTRRAQPRRRADRSD